MKITKNNQKQKGINQKITIMLISALFNAFQLKV